MENVIEIHSYYINITIRIRIHPYDMFFSEIYLPVCVRNVFISPRLVNNKRVTHVCIYQNTTYMY